jgi:hypothetical protein
MRSREIHRSGRVASVLLALVDFAGPYQGPTKSYQKLKCRETSGNVDCLHGFRPLLVWRRINHLIRLVIRIFLF